MRRKFPGVLLLVLMCALVGGGCASSSAAGHTSHVPPTPTPCAPRSSILPPTSLGLPSAGKVSATFSSICPTDADYSIWVTADDSAVWVYNVSTGTVTHIDPASNAIVATISIGAACDQCAGSIAIGDGAIWVDNTNDRVTRIDPHTNKVVATIDARSLGQSSTWLSVTPGAVWVGDYYGGMVSRIDPQTNKMVAVDALSGEPGPLTMSYGAGSLWLCNYHLATGLIRLDPTTLQVQAQIDVSQSQGFGCAMAVAQDQAIWVVAKGPEGSPVLIERVDPTTNRVSAAATPPAQGDGSVIADAHGVWYFDTQLGLFRLDPQTCKVVAQLAMTDGAGGPALGAGSVWVASTTGILSRITPAS